MKAVIYMIICLSFCSELIHCSCLSYGHSCWGAHGKRSSPDRVETEPQQDRWALFKLIQDENDKGYGRDRTPRITVDDSLDYNDRRIPNTLLNALRKRNLPLVILNTADDVAASEMQKPFGISNARKRRSYSTGRNNGHSIQTATVRPDEPSTSADYKYFPA